MNISSVTRAFAAAASAAVLATAIAAPAAADVRTVADAKGDVAGGADIWRVTVTHEKRVRVAIKMDDIVKDFTSDAGATVYVDTDPATAGPDFLLGTPLFEGSDYAMFRTKGWQPVGEPLTCFHNVQLDFDNDVARIAFGRGCLGNPAKVRVAVKTASGQPDGIARDWLVSRRHLTAWVAQG
ncbi:MAG TPA: hypothetical protein VFK52_03330 [Nocardioidaceae bacterium]|nr:hypothetical protein [Nocardioidaceae bacterium]